MFSHIWSICAPDKATLKAEAHALQCTTAGPYNAIPTCLLSVGSVCGLGPDLVGIHSISLAARYRTAACSNTLNQGLEKIQAARAFDFVPILALSSNWEQEFLAPSMARSTAEAFNIVCCLDRNDTLDEVPQDRSRRLPQACSVTNCISRILLDQSPYGPPKLWDRSVVIELRTFCLT